jgi:hypothetical protein
MIDFISEHKDHSVPGPEGESGLRWGVEPLCQVLTEHGIQDRAGDLLRVGQPPAVTACAA